MGTRGVKAPKRYDLLCHVPNFKLGKNDAYSIQTLSSIMPVNGKAPPNLKQLEKVKLTKLLGIYGMIFSTS